MRGLPLFVGFLGVVVLAALSGCGQEQKRHEISGEVKLHGQPVDEGIINFAPLDGQDTGDGAHIKNGKYTIRREKGLAPGKYRVTIYAGNGNDGSGDASPDPPKGGFKPGRDRIPAEYNDKSQVVKEVTKGGPNVFDFDIR